MSRHLESNTRRARGAAWALVMSAAVVALGGCDSAPRENRRGEAGAPPSGGVEVTQRPAVAPTPLPAPVEPASAPVPEVVTFAEAEVVFRSGEYGRAADLFDAYAARVPTNAWGHYMVGLSAWRAGEHERAEAALRHAVQLDSTHLRAQLNLGRVLLEARRAEDALGPITRVVELDPGSVEGWRVLGNVNAELGRVDAAEVAYSNALVVDGRDAWTLNNLGLLLLQDGRYEAALYPLALATELRPEVAVFQNNLGGALERNGYLGNAVEAFRAALAVDDTHEKARVSLARVESRLTGSGGTRVELSRLAAGYAEDVALLAAQGLMEGGVRPSVRGGGPE